MHAPPALEVQKRFQDMEKLAGISCVEQLRFPLCLAQSEAVPVAVIP